MHGGEEAQSFAWGGVVLRTEMSGEALCEGCGSTVFPRGRSSVHGGEEAQSFAWGGVVLRPEMSGEALCSITSSLKLCVPEGDNSVQGEKWKPCVKWERKFCAVLYAQKSSVLMLPELCA